MNNTSYISKDSQSLFFMIFFQRMNSFLNEMSRYEKHDQEKNSKHSVSK